MRKLSGEVKAFIVQSLACFDTPSTVTEAVQRQFGETVPPGHVQCYNPHLKAGAKLSQKWQQLFEETRKAYIEETNRIGISHRAVRLTKLQRHVDLADERGDSLVLAKLLWQAAQEMGAVHPRWRARSGTSGRPIEPPHATDDRTLARAVALILAKGMKQDAGDR